MINKYGRVLALSAIVLSILWASYCCYRLTGSDADAVLAFAYWTLFENAMLGVGAFVLIRNENTIRKMSKAYIDNIGLETELYTLRRDNAALLSQLNQQDEHSEKGRPEPIRQPHQHIQRGRVPSSSS